MFESKKRQRGVHLQTFVYKASRDRSLDEIDIKDEQDQTISILRKNRQSVLTLIPHSLLRDGMPFCYRVTAISGTVLYSINCLMTGIQYTLKTSHSEEKISIRQSRVQLIEKKQLFTLNGNAYGFEKDYTGSARLKRNGELAAVIRNLDSTSIRNRNLIQIEALDRDLASLTAVLYQTFIFEK